jgi:hypothetical protein
VLELLVVNRLIEPGSEFRLHRRWFDHSATDVPQRWKDLFHAEFDLLLYDLTSTYVEGEAESNPKARYGYSRDGRASSPVEDARGVVPWTTSTRRLPDGGPDRTASKW